MRLHRFYVKEISQPLGEEKIIINNIDILHQWHKVLRYNTDDEVILFNGLELAEYIYKIEDIKKKETALFLIKRVELDNKHYKNHEYNKITLCMSMVKGTSFEEIVEKAVEIGIDEIIPILSERSEKKDINRNRTEKIIIESSEQSGRISIAKLENIHKIKDIIEREQENNIKHIIFHTKKEEDLEVKDFINEKDNIFIWIGPEGGWSETEIEYFENMKKEGVNINFTFLPTHILRATTAAPLAVYEIIRQ